MKAGNKQRWTAYALIIITVALLAVTVWLVLAHRPPMDRPGPPPEALGQIDGPRPDGPPPGMPPEGPFEVRDLGFPDLQIQRLPLALSHRRRWLVPYQARETGEPTFYWGVLLSDDDGKSWRKIRCAAPPVPGVLPGHGGLRWIHCGLEPIVAEDFADWVKVADTTYIYDYTINFLNIAQVFSNLETMQSTMQYMPMLKRQQRKRA